MMIVPCEVTCTVIIVICMYNNCMMVIIVLCEDVCMVIIVIVPRDHYWV